MDHGGPVYMYTTAIESLRAMYYPVLLSFEGVWVGEMSRGKRDSVTENLYGWPTQRYTSATIDGLEVCPS